MGTASGQPLPSRWLVALGAFLMQFALGAIYSFSVYTPTLSDASEFSDNDDWSSTQTQIVFSAGLLTFSLVMVWAGHQLKTLGPRTLSLASAFTMMAGYALSSYVDLSFVGVLVFLGFVSGAGIGLGYVVPIAVGVKWFPDKKGTITGLAVAGFGFGATVWIQIGEVLLKDPEWGINNVWRLYAIVFFVLIVAGAAFMVEPNVHTDVSMPNVLRDKKRAAPTAAPAAPAGDVFVPSEMLRTPQFWMEFAVFALNAGAGLMAIGNMKIFPKEALQEHAGMTEDEASKIAGNAMSYFFSLANGFGRIAWGLISEKIGRMRSLYIMSGIQGVFVLLFVLGARSEWTLYLNALAIGFNFGGNFALFPSLTADIFGAQTVGQNYPYVFLAYGLGGTVGPILGGLFADAGSSAVAFIIAGIAVLGSSFIAFLLKKPTKKGSVQGAGDVAGCLVPAPPAPPAPRIPSANV